MNDPVKADPGAGVGESGVETPWENGNLGKGDGDWSCRGRGNPSPQVMNQNRKNSAGTGQEWDHPFEEMNSNDGGDQSQVAEEN